MPYIFGQRVYCVVTTLTKYSGSSITGASLIIVVLSSVGNNVVQLQRIDDEAVSSSLLLYVS